LRLFLSVVSLLFRALPRGAANAIGGFLGLVWYYLIPVRRNVARENLERAFPDLTRQQRRRIARACYKNLARSAVEFLRLPGLTPKKVDRDLEHAGWEHYQEAEKNGKGMIVVTAHFGNFDLLACAEALRGVPLHVISREQHAKGVNRFWMKVRENHGVRFIPPKDSIFGIHKLLKNQQVVALVIDQHMPVGRGIAVPFFGEPASTTHAPAMLSLTTGAPIVPATIERLKGGRHRVTLDAAVQVNREAERNQEAVRITEELNRWLEDKIRKKPDHWLWIHRRWKLKKNTGTASGPGA
jgi:KDO2-lipid IV(A) lauroyltransferase